jgi:hypothetical protein
MSISEHTKSAMQEEAFTKVVEARMKRAAAMLRAGRNMAQRLVGPRASVANVPDHCCSSCHERY